MAKVLELKGVKRWYVGSDGGKLEILRGVDLTVSTGESVAIVGPSGSGKSTLMHVAGLLDASDAGKVLVEGADASGLNDDARAGLRNHVCGFVYQHHHLLREFTALENVMMPAKIGEKARRGEGEEGRALELLEKVGLAKRVGHYPNQLSGGEQQRVAIARALMNKPKLLLADEPTGNLDPHTAEEVADLLFGIMADEGMAAVLVTHNMALAERCARMLKMADGRLV